MQKNITIEKPQTIDLQQHIRDKIEQIKAYEKDIPAMIIVHDLRDWSVVYMSERARNWLETSMEELWAMGTNYHKRFFNPEDSIDYGPKIMGMLERDIDGEIISHFQQVRRSPDHEWCWFLSSDKVILRGDEGQPVLVLTTAIPVDAQHHIAAKAKKLMEENIFHRHHRQTFNGLTKREREILAMMASGYTSAEIAEHLHISETTAATHRRNIKAKLKAENNYDIAKFAQAFDLI